MRSLALASLFLVACPATDVFVLGDGGPGFDSGARPDARGGPDAGRVCGPSPTCVDACPRPWLLTVVQDLNTVECGGQVLRYSLQAPGEFCVCESLPLEDELPTAVGYVPGPGGSEGHVVVAAEFSVSAFGPSPYRYTYADGSYSGIDIFPVEDLDGTLRAAVVQRFTSSDSRILFFDGSDDPIVRTGRDAGVVASTNSYSLSPQNRRWLRRSASRAAADVEVWTGDVVNNELFSPLLSSGSIHAYFHDGLYRTVVAYGSGVFSLALAEEINDQSPAGIRCSDPEFNRCNFTSAVSDPFSSDGDIYAICTLSSDMFAASIIHLSMSGECEVVQSAELWPDARIWRLGLALDNYWAP